LKLPPLVLVVDKGMDWRKNLDMDAGSGLETLAITLSRGKLMTHHREKLQPRGMLRWRCRYPELDIFAD